MYVWESIKSFFSGSSQFVVQTLLNALPSGDGDVSACEGTYGNACVDVISRQLLPNSNESLALFKKRRLGFCITYLKGMILPEWLPWETTTFYSLVIVFTIAAIYRLPAYSFKKVQVVYVLSFMFETLTRWAWSQFWFLVYFRFILDQILFAWKAIISILLIYSTIMGILDERGKDFMTQKTVENVKS